MLDTFKQCKLSNGTPTMLLRIVYGKCITRNDLQEMM